MYEFIQYQVRDVMTVNPITITKDDKVGRAEEIFVHHDFNGLPVVGDDGRLLGLVTKLDLLKAFAFKEETMVPPYQDIMERNVTEIMNPAPVVMRPDIPLTRVLMKMIETRYKSFPVVDDQGLIGIVAREDVLTALNRAAQGQVPERMQQNRS